MAQSFRHTLIQFARELSDEQDAAFDLWSWLPSFQVARKNHPGYEHSVRPSNERIMRECAFEMSKAAGYTPEPHDVKHWAECPCGDSHEEPTE